MDVVRREKPEPLVVPETINQVWSMDFMRDQLTDGRSFRLFNVIDDFNREALGMNRFLAALGPQSSGAGADHGVAKV